MNYSHYHIISHYILDSFYINIENTFYDLIFHIHNSNYCKKIFLQIFVKIRLYTQTNVILLEWS